MKKFFKWLTIFPTALLLVACTPSENVQSMTVEPAELSEETQCVMEMLDEEILFWDCDLDESIRSCSVRLWKCEDGQWKDVGGMYGEIHHEDTRIGLRMSEDKWDLYEWNENGYTRYRQESAEMDFSDFSNVFSTKLSTKTTFLPEEELTLWMKLAGNNSRISATADGDFRNSNCDAGMAVTVTFFTHEIEP